jgi:hypothetical protein
MDKLFSKVNINKYSFIFLFVIVVLGFLLRSHDLNTWPRKGATFDEYAWTWQGISIIQNGVPTSWSYHPQYKNRKLIIYQKTNFIMVTPYLEHPPVFGLVAGSYALLNGVKGIYNVDIDKIRGLAIILGLASIVSLYFLTNELYGKKVALFSSFLYAIIPTIAIGSRIVQNENFFIPVWIISLFLTVKFIKTKKSLYRNIAAILCGFLGLAKVPWLAGAFSIVIIFIYLKRYNDIFKFLIIVVPIFLLFFVYGFYYDKEVFLGLWNLQLNRYDLDFTSIYALFQKPYLADRFYLDGWIYWGWFSLVLLFTKDVKKNLFIIAPILVYFLVFLIAIPDEPGHGWYRYPFYPFLVVSIALFIKEYFAKNWILTFLFLVFVGSSLLQLTWVYKFGFSYILFRLVIITWMLILAPQFLHIKLAIKQGKIISFLWLCALFALSAWSILIYNEQ